VQGDQCTSPPQTFISRSRAVAKIGRNVLPFAVLHELSYGISHEVKAASSTPPCQVSDERMIARPPQELAEPGLDAQRGVVRF